MNNLKVINELENLINKGFTGIKIPHVKGENIQIGKISIKKNKFGYTIYDTDFKSKVANTYCKSSAVAIAKNLAHGKDIVNQALSLDRIIEKNFIDAIFFKNIILITRDNIRKDVLQCRLDIATARTTAARNQLDYYIYS
tara:strand:+ start:1216 stop:1635 length:420 start_codon:yes stop_codon:yes gene_type:complete